MTRELNSPGSASGAAADSLASAVRVDWLGVLQVDWLGIEGLDG
jgi:hypothetical protein